MLFFTEAGSGLGIIVLNRQAMAKSNVSTPPPVEGTLAERLAWVRQAPAESDSPAPPPADGLMSLREVLQRSMEGSKVPTPPQ